MLRLVIVSVVVAVVLGGCPPPDGTEQHFVFKDCAAASGISNPRITTQGARITGPNGEPDYPVAIEKALMIDLNQTNTGALLAAFYEDVEIDLYKKDLIGLGHCQWRSVETFGALNGLPGCAINECPVPSGSYQSKKNFDFSKYSSILNLLPDEYALRLTLRQKATKSTRTHFGCVQIELRIKK